MERVAEKNKQSDKKFNNQKKISSALLQNKNATR